MSETTKRNLGADMIDLSVPWARRIDPTHLAARPVDQQALRASRLGAEGGVAGGTTNSPAEIGAGCTGRKWALLTVALAVMAVCMSLLVSELGLALGLLAFAWSFAAGYLLGKFWVVPIVEAKRMARLRASGEGIR